MSQVVRDSYVVSGDWWAQNATERTKALLEVQKAIAYLSFKNDASFQVARGRVQLATSCLTDACTLLQQLQLPF